MSRLRARIIAVQAIVVSLLLVIVFLTILRPDDENTLRGVDAPQGEPQTAGDGGRDPDGNGQAGEDEDDTAEAQGPGGGEITAGTTAGGGAEGPIGPGTSTDVGSATATGTPVGEAGDDDGGGSPSDDQYADTVSRLMSALYEEP